MKPKKQNKEKSPGQEIKTMKHKAKHQSKKKI